MNQVLEKKQISLESTETLENRIKFLANKNKIFAEAITINIAELRILKIEIHKRKTGISEGDKIEFLGKKGEIQGFKFENEELCYVVRLMTAKGRLSDTIRLIRSYERHKLKFIKNIEEGD